MSDLLILPASLNLSPVASVCFVLSDPARSISVNLDVRYELGSYTHPISINIIRLEGEWGEAYVGFTTMASEKFDSDDPMRA